MRLDDGILLAVEACEPAHVGRTALQKLMYFASRRGVVDAEFSAHYYGPYSQEVASEVASLVDLNFLEEQAGVVYASGNVGYVYRLTEEGRQVLPGGNGQKKLIRAIVSSAVSRLSLNPRLLATAAKVHFILDSSHEPMVPQKIRERAGRLGWELEEADIFKVIDYLKDLELVATEP
ncbi:MAG: hypothetical protein QW379_08205 [Thermoplasmata archaeon]